MFDASDRSLLDQSECWPALPYAAGKDTLATLHMGTQIVGKIRLALTPKVNHCWNVPTCVSARGLTTSVIPYGKRAFEMEFDFADNKLLIQTNDPSTKTIALAPRSVVDFYSLGGSHGKRMSPFSNH